MNCALTRLKYCYPPSWNRVHFFQAGVSGTTSRPITKRVAELPSLRYGPIGARTTGTGPLRVTTTHYHESDTIPKRSSKKSNISNDTGSFKPVRPVRKSLSFLKNTCLRNKTSLHVYILVYLFVIHLKID